MSRLPVGWFVVADSDDLPTGTVLPVQLCGREVVLYRGEDGRAVALDAHCAHLGAHLAYGGVVDGCGIRCPFHNWRYGPDGRCDSIPYRTEPGLPDAQLRTWPCLEQHGLVLLHHHPDGEAPTWCPTPHPVLGVGTWTRFHQVSVDVRIRPQDVIENLADTVHFRYVHDTPTVPIGEVTIDGPVWRQTMIGHDVDGQEEYRTVYAAVGLGVMWMHMPAQRMMVLTTVTPLDAGTVRFGLRFSADDDGLTEMKRARMAALIVESTFRDIPIWEHRVMPAQPRLLAEDATIALARRWCRQFDPIDATDG